MTLLGVFGVLLGLVAIRWVSVKLTNRKIALFAIMFVLHIGSAIVYYYFVQVNDADSYGYYYDPYGFFYSRGFGLSTQFVIYMVHTLKMWFGGTYLDYFLLFQSFGFMGFAFLARIVEEVFMRLSARPPVYIYVLLFLPGTYFWSSAIGKDAPLFLAAAMAVWASLEIKRRYIWFAIAVAIMILFRAHIALIAMGAMAVMVMLDFRTRVVFRVLLLLPIVVGGYFIMSTLQDALGVDLANAASVSGFFERQATSAVSLQGDSTVADAPFYFRLFSLLFRPMFLDADGVFGLIASAENVLLLGIFIVFAIQSPFLLRLAIAAPFVRYCLFYSLTIILLLSELYYNVGLGLRQKTMILPALVAMFCAVVASRQQLLARAARARAVPPEPIRWPTRPVAKLK